MTQRAYSVRRAADDYDLSETTIRDAINRQELPAYRAGRAIRIAADDLEQWFRGLARVGQEEPEGRRSA